MEHKYINKEMEGCQNNSSQWKLIRNCLPRKETTQQVYTREVKEVAEEFKDFFVIVGVKASEASKALIATYELSPPNEFTSRQYIPDEEKFNFRAVSSHVIRRAVMSFSSNKAPGFDIVTMSVIKDALPECELIPINVSFSCSVENI